MKSGVFLVAFCARLKTYGALFGDKNHKAFSRFCLCGHEKSGLVAHGVTVVEIQPHNPEDPEQPDLIWLKRYTDGGMCEGEYLFVGESRYKDSDRVDLWVGHKSADVCGGHPTYWANLIPAGNAEAIQTLINEHWPKGN